MNYNLIKSISSCVFIFIISVVSCQYPYHIEYEKECEFALNFYEEHKIEFQDQGTKIHVDAPFMFSIVAPEVSQFVKLSNTIETYSLKVLYVQYGKGYADFSIGHFQMKPSFIEGIENYIANNKELKIKYESYLFHDSKSKNARIERIDRLNSISWQIKYLSVFCDLIHHKFNTIQFVSNSEKVRFFASAYNSGFHKSENELKSMQKTKCFPRFGIEKYNYSDIANWFYHNI